MLFGLTNAPTTFQSIMNSIFHKYLRKFVIIFFDDILIYSASLENHVLHLRRVFELREHQLLAKLSKCTCGRPSVGFLGHIIASDGVHPDPEKIKAMVEWRSPSNIKLLRGFLGLTGYCRRFIQNYASIATPMTNLLRKDSFKWTETTDESFKKLKEDMITAPILAFPDSSLQFEIEIDECGLGIGVVLMQKIHPIAFYSCKLSERMLGASFYIKKMYATTQSVHKWGHYLLGSKFIIRTDHRSLTNLLTQVIQTPNTASFRL